MSLPERVFLHVWSGTEADAHALVQRHYPGCEVVGLSHRLMRESSRRDQVRVLRSLIGRAVVFFFQSVRDAHYRQLLSCTGLLHHCSHTVIADSSGVYETYRRRDWLWLLPKMLGSAVTDGVVLAFFWVFLHLIQLGKRAPVLPSGDGDLDVAYLYPYPLNRSSVPGGAMSHVRGVLGGFAKSGASSEVFSACLLPSAGFRTHQIEPGNRPHLFWETLVLSYNLRFARAVRAQLRGKRPRVLYQRHMPFTYAGAILSRWLRVPLILEFNGSNVWMAQHWDPMKFGSWLRMCEDVSLAHAWLIVVVSEVLRDELMACGISESRILVNPNAVDPDFFRPGRGGREVRQQLGVTKDDVLVGFIGTFGPWHGVKVLQQAIEELLREPAAGKKQLHFVLVGEGLLYPEVANQLAKFCAAGKVSLTGLLPHDQIPSYLDACDILVSPHISLPGRRFFGSPTKLFEYMAMGKAIVASNLDQLAQVLQHNRTAWLVEPGNTKELTSAITLLAEDPELRERLGRAARATAVEKHSWRQNAKSVLARIWADTYTAQATPAPQGYP